MAATKKRGRPPKNVIGGKTNEARGRGRPAKNIIQPRKSKNKPVTNKVTKKVVKKPKKVIKKPAKQTISKGDLRKSKKLIDKKINERIKGFQTHKVTKKEEHKGNNFALWLLIASVLLFGFSIYKAFFFNDAEPINTQTIVQTKEYELLKNINNSGENKNTIIIDSEIKTNPGSDIYPSENIINDLNIQTAKYSIPTITFKIAYTLNEAHPDIEILQKFLSNEGFFNEEITGLYGQETINAMFDFQLKYKILDENAIKQLKGYFGPSTREKVNQLISQ